MNKRTIEYIKNILKCCPQSIYDHLGKGQDKLIDHESVYLYDCGSDELCFSCSLWKNEQGLIDQATNSEKSILVLAPISNPHSTGVCDLCCVPTLGFLEHIHDSEKKDFSLLAAVNSYVFAIYVEVGY